MIEVFLRFLLNHNFFNPMYMLYHSIMFYITHNLRNKIKYTYILSKFIPLEIIYVLYSIIQNYQTTTKLKILNKIIRETTYEMRINKIYITTWFIFVHLGVFHYPKRKKNLKIHTRNNKSLCIQCCTKN